MPEAKFLAGFWSLGEDAAKASEWKAAVSAHLVATTLADAVEACVREARAAADEVKSNTVQEYSVTPEPTPLIGSPHG
jgi:hypothetical protein